MSTEKDRDEPPYARLGAGVTLDDVAEAIKSSGYPLQADVASVIEEVTAGVYRLVPSLQEEWTYIDSDSGQARSIDVLAEFNFARRFDNISRAELKENEDAPSGDSHFRHGPELTLLVECKQSELPYVFFVRHHGPSETHDFPELAGLSTTDIILHDGDEKGLSNFVFHMSAHDILGLSDLPLFRGPGRYSGSISKAVRRGKAIELTGEEAYKSLMLPLAKAADHFKELHEPRGDLSEWFYRINMVIPLAVLRAPMLASIRNGSKHELVPIPWVRAWRVEPRIPGQYDQNYRYMDVIHESFLREYMTMMVRDFQVAAEGLEVMHEVFTEGRGVAMFGGPELDASEGDEGGEPRQDDDPPYKEIRSLTEAEKVWLETEGSDELKAGGMPG